MANVITTKLDLDGKGFVSQLRAVQASIASADTASGKLKAGFSGLGQVLKANVAEAAAAAGTALVAFGTQSVKAFQDTALEAGKMSDATGVTVEEASRLAEVASDIGIELGSLQGAMLRFNKAASDGSVEVEGFGNTVVRASDGTVDAYQSFINAATAIGAIEDPTKRAKAAQETFGRSYGEIAELMEMDAKDLRRALADVSDEQVIDAGEERKAKQFRAALDGVGDAVTRLQLAVGEYLVPKLTELADTANTIIESDLLEWLDKASQYTDRFTLDVTEVVEKLEQMGDALRILTGNELVGYGEALDKSSAATESLSGASVGLTRDLEDEQRQLDKTAAATRAAEREARDLENAISDLKDELSDDAAWLDAQDAVDEFAWNMNSGTLSAREQERALVDVKSELLDYVETVDEIPAEQKKKIVAEIDSAKTVEDILRIQRELAKIPTSIGVSVRVAPGGVVIPKSGAYASGTENARPGVALVGENGPELVMMGGGERVIPAGRTRDMLGAAGGDTYNISIQTNADPNSTKAAMRRWSRRNGPGLS